jgi:hypothetical protein
VDDVVDAERRCPACGALVSADAAWCGQCYADLRTLEPEPTPGDGSDDRSGRPGEPTPSPEEPFWPCPVCAGRNPIELEACATCGTPFAELMRDEPVRPDITPKDALAWSLVFPGLGHRLAGRPLDGLARGVLFAVAFLMALLVGFAGVRSGLAFLVFALFLLTGLAVYAGSAFEAYRLASGGDLLVSSRTLLWVLVGVVLVAVVLLALVVVGASRVRGGA